ncbi:Septum site-determining protein MinD [compost metagenome]
MQGKTIVVTSGKGGVGKTTMTANLGMALATSGARVCLIDTDTGLRNLDLILGVEQRIVFDLVDVIRGNCRLQQALIRDRREPNLYFIPASQRAEKSDIKPSDMRLIVASLRETFDFILIDCPAGIEEGFQVAIAAADQALVVVNPEVASVRDADRVVGLLEQAGIKETQLVINRVRAEMIARNDMISPSDVEELLGVPALAVLPDDPSVIVSTNRGEPVVLDRNARLRKTFEDMAQALRGDGTLVVAPQIGPVTFLGRLKSMFAS